MQPQHANTLPSMAAAPSMPHAAKSQPPTSTETGEPDDSNQTNRTAAPPRLRPTCSPDSSTPRSRGECAQCCGRVGFVLSRHDESVPHLRHSDAKDED